MDSNFRARVYALVEQIPKGKVMTYGDIASYCGHPNAARVVGQIAHFGPSYLPWHRVVNRFGGLARGYWGGREVHKAMLESEDIKINEEFVIIDFSSIKWHP